MYHAKGYLHLNQPKKKKKPDYDEHYKECKESIGYFSPQCCIKQFTKAGWIYIYLQKPTI